MTIRMMRRSRSVSYTHLLRDADKIDILKVNVELPLEEIYNVDTEVLYPEEVTPEVLQRCFAGLQKGKPL